MRRVAVGGGACGEYIPQALAEVVRRLQKAFPDIRVSKSAVHHDAVQYYMTEGE